MNATSATERLDSVPMPGTADVWYAGTEVYWLMPPPVPDHTVSERVVPL